MADSDSTGTRRPWVPHTSQCSTLAKCRFRELGDGHRTVSFAPNDWRVTTDPLR